jgi:hypothetical protein
MQTNIANGDAITVGASCMLVFLLTTADSILESMPPEVAAQYGDALAPIVAKLATGIDVTTFDEDPVTGDMVPLELGIESSQENVDDDKITPARRRRTAPAAKQGDG